ncbi:MAG: GDP-mannose 4,6-dehydratase [Acidobacteriaceae bacterium]|nr:GDP-mannose 4,6-dehydratase [Acidobacteriaceae bacterium]
MPPLSTRSVLITGGAGFIGTNVARSYLEKNQPVHIFDNLSRPHVEQNVHDLLRSYPGKVQFTHADVRDRRAIEKAIETAGLIYHLAAQVAVTTSLEDPIGDVETNLMGTLHVLEAVRKSHTSPSLLFTSTNKVYGRLASVPVSERRRRHEPADASLAQSGISESQPLEFLSPYGCSKGSADQYVLDYAHSYGIRACVFRMSCIYGTYQVGSEDQGWVAHFLRQALKGEPITVYGDGKQVRDLLFVDDLVHAMHLVHGNMDLAAGQVFNIGGGPQNSSSLLELIDEIRLLTGNAVNVEWGPERLADQRWFIADTSKIHSLLGWRPHVSIREGLRTLHEWYLSRGSLVQAQVQVA